MSSVRLAREDIARLKEIDDVLSTYSLTSDSLLTATAAVRDALGAKLAVTYSLTPTVDQDLRVGIGEAPGVPSFRAVIDEWLLGRGCGVTGYSPIRPEPWQRNRVFRGREVNPEPSALECALYPRFGVAGCDTMRVLICERQSLLAWVGIIHDSPTTERQRKMLRHLAPRFKRRLQFERQIQEQSLRFAAMLLALEAIGRAAWLLDCHGLLAEANVVGRERLDTERATLRNLLRSCVGGHSVPSLHAHRIADSHGHHGWLVLDATPPSRVKSSVALATRRWSLTPTQHRVLDLVVAGLSNSTIAAELTIAERTVEAHLTAIFEKAQLPTRAALIASVLVS